MVEEGLIPNAHRAHKVARLVIADSIPEGGLFLLKMIDPVDIGFAFHQPMGHGILDI